MGRNESDAAAPEVYSAEEISRAGGVPTVAVRQLIAAGEIATVDGELVAQSEAVRAVRRLRAHRLTPIRQVFGSALLDRSIEDSRPTALSVAMSTSLHGIIVLVAVLLTTVRLTTAAHTPVSLDGPTLSRLVFVAKPGPGGGGGGGGLRQPLPPPKAERRGASRVSSPVPPRDEPTLVEPVEEKPEPEPLENEELPRIFAPLVEARADLRDVRGLLEDAAPPAPVDTSPSQGPGLENGIGRGAGRGVGPGRGAGVGPGTGGGTGDGPYRSGSGISPPAIRHEVKPDYTEEARRRAVEGDVVLEIVVLSDGTVGDVRVLRSLGYGLDEQAVRAMREWRFHAAQRQGVPVDVVVEVAMEFRLR